MTVPNPERSMLTHLIKSIIREVHESQTQNELPTIDEETVLLESGLDSLGFAVVVTRLEEELGYDPFSLADEPYYPARFGELVDFYFKYAPK